jgi:quinol monooxygenase YgiN
MYGTVARMKAKPGAEAKLKEAIKKFDSRYVPGAINAYLYRMDADPDEFYIAAIFQDKETYLANAESPEQDAEYQQMRELLVADPEWHDGEIVYTSR